MEFSCMSFWEAHNPLSTRHMTWLKGLREESMKAKTGVLSARKWPHMTTLYSDSTRRRVWKTLHSGNAMPRKPLEKLKRKHSPVGLEWPLDMYWRLLSAVFWDRESPYSNARSKSHRFSQVASRDLCKFPSLFQALARGFVAAVLLCTFLKLFLRCQVFQDRYLVGLKYDRTARFQCSMRANKNKKNLKI